MRPDKEYQDNGYCHFLEQGDWEDIGVGLLWDQCKCCQINVDLDNDQEI